MPDENKDSPRPPIEVVKEARDAAMEVVDDSPHQLGAVVIITIPPHYDSVRYATNMGDKGAASLMQSVSQRIIEEMNGGSPNIETP